jgi:hypothetical protein
MMRALLLTLLMMTSLLAAENPLSVRVLKADREGRATYLLFSVTGVRLICE